MRRRRRGELAHGLGVMTLLALGLVLVELAAVSFFLSASRQRAAQGARR